MRSTLVGVIRVDPAELLEEGLLRELDGHISKKFFEFIEPTATKKSNNLLPRLQKLAESMDGYKRSLEYIQDYINIHGLRIWQKQVSAIINQSVAKEISIRKGVSLFGPSASFMGSLARQIVQITDARMCVYINISAAWFDVKNHSEVINTKTFAKLNEAIGVLGLHGLDTLYGYMIKNQLQHIQNIFRSNADKIAIGNTDVKDLDQVITKGYKTYQQVSDLIIVIGTLQILRKHIAYQLNTSCKFDSAHLEASLRTMNESLLNEIKKSAKSESKIIPLELLHSLEEYLVRCGIYEPFEKIYAKNAHEFINSDMGRLMAIVLIAQLPRLQVCLSTGDLITKKPGENIDGYPLLVGIYTLLRQSKTESVENFVQFLCKYAKVVTINKLKSGESTNEGTFIIRVLQLFCETFNYSFSKIEDKLPLVLLTQAPQK